MKKIYDLQIDLSEMPTEAVARSFSVSGERDAEFILNVIQNDTIKYYDFVDEAFELGHNDKNNNLKVVIGGSDYTDIIKFPAGGGTYTIKLIALSGTEAQGKNVISKSIDKQATNNIVTFTAATAATTAANYATFPTTTSTGGSTSVGNFDFNWDIANASTDAGGFGLRLLPTYINLTEKHWYFTTTDTVDGAVSSSTTVVVDDTTDIVAGMTISGVSSGSLSGIPVILSIDTVTKTLILNHAQTFADGITLTFRATGSAQIKNAIGLDVQFPNPIPTVVGTV